MIVANHPRHADRRQLQRHLPADGTDADDRRLTKAALVVEEEVVGRGIRAIFLKSAIDTADRKRWRLLLNTYANIDEFVTSMYADNIRIASTKSIRSCRNGSKLSFAGTSRMGCRWQRLFAA